MKSVNSDYLEFDVENAKIVGSEMFLDHDEKTLIWSIVFRMARKDVTLSLPLGKEGLEYPYSFSTIEGCAELIRSILSISTAGSLSKLVGQHVRIGLKGDQVRTIGHIIDDKWIYPYVITCQK